MHVKQFSISGGRPTLHFSFLLAGFFILTGLSGPLKAQNKKAYHVLVGTYTNGKSKGIQVYSFDARTGKMVFEHEVPLNNPSYLNFSPDARVLYAVSENNGTQGKVTAYSFDAHSGDLTLLNSFPSGGIAPCYVSTDQTGKLVFVANYSSGTIAAFHTQADGSLKENPQILTNEGSSINKARQEHAHAHSAVVSPDNKFLFTADLGVDKEFIYRIDAADSLSPLKPATPAYFQAEAGNGPRHFIFDTKGKFAYLVQELSGSITTFTYEDGKIEPVQTISLLPSTLNGIAGAADIHMSADGRFVYASNRAEYNDLSIFSVDSKSGKLSFAGRSPSYGKTPRNFSIAPDGNYLVVANQKSDDIFVLPRDKRTGKLSAPVGRVEAGAPVCIRFAEKK